MSEYLSKKAVLESVGEAYQTNLESPDQTDWDEGYRSALRFMKRTVLSGAFDADNTEIQRLRSALGHIHAIAQSELDDLQYEGQRKTFEEILLTAEEELKGDGNE